ncbi:hypothetical protein BVD23_03615 [Salmonella enterica]|nr:hypothetical protein [Salmonella enterica]ECJ5917657.1 hypothetical protein [Salmonella enterica subsp. salamae]EAN4944493.1 hypothetical protein [Salmonella enterica]EAX8453402.1 hypothetical protein [Salmonella enterica]EAX8554412.1 hypothetical protein [Salmonella enterica]
MAYRQISFWCRLSGCYRLKLFTTNNFLYLPIDLYWIDRFSYKIILRRIILYVFRLISEKKKVKLFIK